MSGGRKILAGAIVILILGGFLAFILVAITGPGRQETVLPDGTIVRLASVTFGKTFRYVEASGWRKIAGNILPEKYLTKLGIRSFLFTNPTPTVFVCIEAVKTNGYLVLFPYPRGIGIQSWGKSYDFRSSAGASAELTDDAGNSFVLADAMCTSFLNSTNPYISVLTFPVTSHGASILDFRVNQSDYKQKTNYVSHFRARNPVGRSSAGGRAQSLPQTNAVDDLEVELVSLEPGGPHTWHVDGTQASAIHGTIAKLHVLQNGAPSTNWEVSGVTIADEEGNVFTPHCIEHLGPYAISFDGVFSPNEARKFRFELSRIPPFTATEQSTFVILGKNGVGGEELHLPCATLRYFLESVAPTSEGEWLSAYVIGLGNPSAAATAPAGFHFQYFVTGMDTSGKESILLDRGAEHWPNIADNVFTIPSNIPPESLKITFAVTKSRFLEFIAKPAGASTNR